MNQSFADFIRSHGCEPKSDIPVDVWVRGGYKNSIAVKLFDGQKAGCLHNWRTGENYIWYADDNNRPSHEIPKIDYEAIKQAQDAKQNLAYASVAKQAERLFNNAPEASNEHAYLIKKKVKAYGIKQIGHELLIPIYSIHGGIQSIEFITDGIYSGGTNKRFLSSAKKKGGFHYIGEFDANKPIYIAEGYATAVSVYEDTKCFSLVAFDAGNLEPVAREFRAQFSDVEIVIAGDCDKTGIEAALKASRAVNGKAIFPDFGENPEGYTDWNDYFNMGVWV